MFKVTMLMVCMLLRGILNFGTSVTSTTTFDKEYSDQEEWLKRKINTGGEPVFCTDRSMRSPIDVQGETTYQAFDVLEAFKHSYKSVFTKLSDHVYKLDGEFGYIGYNNVKYDILYAIFRAPSEHRVEGERVAMELQVVCKNANKERIVLMVMFQVSHEKNHLLSLLGFGKGVLSKLDNSNPIEPQRHEVKDIAASLKPFFMNGNAWLKYDGHDLNPPCYPATWLISIEPAYLSLEQLNDFSPLARPDFTIKTLGERKLYRSNLNENSLDPASWIARQEAENEKMQALMEKKRKEAEAKKAAEEEAKRKKEQHRIDLIMQYRRNKAEMQFKKPPLVSEEPMVTVGLLRQMMNDILLHNYMHTPCKEYLVYDPPIAYEYGYMPADAIAPWEIRLLIHENKNITVPTNTEFPDPSNSTYSYQPFYFIKMPDCHSNVSAFQMLAQTENSSEEANKTKYIPVIVETDKNYHSPKNMAPTFLMAVPGANPELQEVPIHRKLIPEAIQPKLQDLELAKQHQDTFGHIAFKPERSSLSLVQPLLSPKDYKGKVIKIWPSLNLSDGTLPSDAVFAWEGLKESDIIVNSTIPASFNPKYRWIALMYLRSNYSIGDDNKVPYFPIYILARNDFVFQKGKLPDYIPVPRSAEEVGGQIPAELLSLKFTAAKSIDVLTHSEALQLPIGYNPEEIFKTAETFREKMYLLKAETDPAYFKEVHERYVNKTDGNQNELKNQERVEITGIILEIDKRYRNKKKQDQEAEEKKLKERLDLEYLREQRIQGIWNDDTRIVQYEKYCKKYGVEVVLNDRHDFLSRDKVKADFRICLKWGWRVKSKKNENKVLPHEEKKIKVDNATKPITPQTPEEIKKNVIRDVRKYCLEKLHVVLNDRRFEAKNHEYYELCRDTLQRLRKSDLSFFMASMGPALQMLRDAAIKSADKLERLSDKLGDKARNKAETIRQESADAKEDLKRALERVSKAAAEATKAAANKAIKTTAEQLKEHFKDAIDKTKQVYNALNVKKNMKPIVLVDYPQLAQAKYSKRPKPVPQPLLTSMKNQIWAYWSRFTSRPFSHGWKMSSAAGPSPPSGSFQPKSSHPHDKN